MEANPLSKPEAGYIDAIDGLRALAVLAVVFCHAELGFSGGFVGVDVFFVISGFLITRLIYRDLEAGTFSMIGFWERRLRRILPALFAMLLGVFFLGAFLMLPDAFTSYSASLTAAIGMFSNFYFWLSGGYFADPAKELPLLHTWSLSLEEQFYVLLPAALFLVYKFRTLRNRYALMAVCAAGMLVSLACSWYMVRQHWISAYYLLPSRGWELLLGSMLGLLPAGVIRLRRLERELLAVLGLVAILLPAWFYNGRTSFPGLAALPVCLGAVALIVATLDGKNAPTLVGRALSSPIPRFFGLISFSLYLWHWPLLAIANQWGLLHSQTGDATRLFWPRIAIVAASVILATLSYRFVELPFRNRRVLKSRRAIWTFSGASAAILMLAGLLMVQYDGLPQRIPERALAYLNAQRDHPIERKPIKAAEVRQDKIISVNREPNNTNSSVLLWGDSHARGLIPAFLSACKKRDEVGYAIVNGGVPPLLDYVVTPTHEWNRQTVPLGREVISYIQRHRIRTVVLAAKWNEHANADPVKFEKSFAKTVEAINAQGAMVYVFLQVPEHSSNIPRHLALTTIVGHDFNPSVVASLEQHQRGSAQMKRIASCYSSEQCLVIDSTSRFFQPQSDRCLTLVDGNAAYCDDDHLSSTGARRLMTGYFDEILSGDLARTSLVDSTTQRD
jgi:peptidoglycan/LPS O-acetylase OafA/YrhL